MPHHQLLGCCWVGRLNHPMLITVLLLLFKHEGKKELHEEEKCRWSVLRGFSWQLSNSYIMSQPGNLLCYTIFLTWLSTLTSTNLLPCKYWESTHSYMIFQWSKYILSSLIKYRGNVSKKSFSWDLGEIFFRRGTFMGEGYSTWEIHD